MPGVKQRGSGLMGADELELVMPETFGDIERAAWRRVVSALPSDALSQLDFDLLVQYCRSVRGAEEAALQKDWKLFAAMSRMTSSHATRLGITRVSRVAPETRERQADRGTAVPVHLTAPELEQPEHHVQ